MMAAGKVLPLAIQLQLVKEAMSQQGAPAYLIGGFPDSLEELEAFERDVGPIAAALHLKVSSESLSGRAGAADSFAWDYFDDAERAMDAEQLQSSLAGFYTSAATLLAADTLSSRLIDMSTDRPLVDLCKDAVVQLRSHLRV